MIPKDYQYRNFDAAKRMADCISLHQTVLSRDEIFAGRYVAIRLSDGGSDGVAYESRSQAIEYQRHNASRHAYFRIPFEKMSVQACDSILWYVRATYDSGYRADPAHQLIIPERLGGI